MKMCSTGSPSGLDDDAASCREVWKDKEPPGQRVWVNTGCGAVELDLELEL
jgi:hypothetical protein